MNITRLSFLPRDCSYNRVFIVEEHLLEIDSDVTNASSMNSEDGVIAINLGNNFNFSWEHDPSNSSSVAQGLNPGIYCITINDGLCDYEHCETVFLENEDNSDLSCYINILPSCATIFNGLASVNPVNGVAPYFYNWNTGESTQTVTGKKAGIYSLTVTDAAGQLEVYPVTIPPTQNCFTTFTKNIIYPTCDSSDGAIYIGADVQELTNFAFAWFDTENTFISSLPYLENVGQGTYKLVVVDNDGSSSSYEEFLFVLSSEQLKISEIEYPLECEDGDGFVIPSVVFGQKPYSYQWTGPSITESNQDKHQQFNLNTGTYCLTVTDYNECFTQQCITISHYCSLIQSITSSNTCDQADVGSITIDPYPPGPDNDIEIKTYFQGLEISNSWNLTGLAAGEYLTIVRDLTADCQESAYIQITNEYFDLTVEVTDICNGVPGEIDISVEGGMQPYSFEWSTVESGNSITVEQPGNYGYTLTDGNGCSTSDEVEVSSYSIEIVTLSFDYLECVNNETRAVLKGFKNGNVPISVHNVPLNEAYCHREYAFGSETCFDERCLTVKKEPFRVLDVEGIGCAVDGVLTSPTVLGGDEDYSYLWSTGEDSPEITVIEGESYSLTISDGTGCEVEINFNEVIFTSTFEASIPLGMIEYGLVEGYQPLVPITLFTFVSGGSSQYSYMWDDGSSNSSRSIDSPGTYCVTITDGCANNNSVECIEVSYYLPFDQPVVSPDLFDFPSECTGPGKKTTLNLYNWPWNPPFLDFHDVIEIVWPNVEGGNHQITRLNRFWEPGKKAKYKYVSGIEEYILKPEDLFINLPFTIINEDEIVEKVYTRYFTAMQNWDNYSIKSLWQNIELFDYVNTGRIFDCFSCDPISMFEIPTGCNAQTNDYYWRFEPDLITNPCGPGLLFLVDKDGNEVEYSTDLLIGSGTFYNSPPTSLANSVECEFRPGCLWDENTIIPTDLGIHDFPPYKVYASICEGEIPDDLLCPDQEDVEFTWVYDCVFSYLCDFDSEINYITKPKRNYKAQIWGSIPPRYQIISFCGECSGGLGLNEAQYDLVFEDVFTSPENDEILDQYELIDCFITNSSFEEEHEITARNSVAGIYPNPTIFEVTLDFCSDCFEYKIFNISGVLRLSNSFSSTSLEDTSVSIDVSSLHSGLYLLKIYRKDGTYITDKFIIQ